MPDHELPRPPRGPVLAAAAAFAALAVAAALGAAGAWRLVPAEPPDPPAEATSPLSVPSQPVAAVEEPPPLRLEARTVLLERDRTFNQGLLDAGLDAAQAGEVVAALRGSVDFTRLRPGGQLRVERVAGDRALRRLAWRLGPAEEWVVEPAHGGALVARRRPVELTTTVVRVELEIRSSVSEAVRAAGEEATLAVLAADVLAWDVDFYQDVRRGDRMRVLVEKTFADGRFLRYGEVRAAEYAGELARRRLFLWRDPEGVASYYDEAGTSARRGFLKSPLKYAQLTSRFGTRKHPVLGYTRQHEGVDYAAPVGTPVWTVGDGVVAEAGWHGGCGKMVAVRHRNGFVTQYCHLSAIAVKVGERVAQKQVVGSTGQTGLATGPHLHFAVRHGGISVNPLQLKLPREAPVAERWRPEFARAIAPLQAELAGTGVVLQ